MAGNLRIVVYEDKKDQKNKPQRNNKKMFKDVAD